MECVNKGLAVLPEGMDPETQVLDLSGSTLQNLHPTLFQRYGLVNLQRVYLARSRLGHLHDSTFQGLTNLIELDLGDNMLTSIPVGALAELPALMRLSLARNPIRRVAAGSFRTLRYLTNLELSQCQIETVEAGAFDGLKTLEWLKLDGNALSSVGGSPVLPRSLRGVTLHDNPWQCNCQLGQLRAWLVQLNVPLAIEPKCSEPERVAGRQIKSLDPTDFACAPQISTSPEVVEVPLGANVTLSCEVSGDPDPRIAWFHNGQKITTSYSTFQPIFAGNNDTEGDSGYYYSLVSASGSDALRSDLYIVNAASKENGTYVCTAENRAGYARANFTLAVSPLPTQPPPPPVNADYMFKVSVVVGAIVITMLIIVAAVAMRCYCCTRRRNHRTRDKTANNLASLTDNAKNKPHSNLSPNLPPRPVQMLPTSLSAVKGNVAYAAGGVSDGMGNGLNYGSAPMDTALDQSPDLINDTTATKWKEPNTQAVCLVDGPYSPAMYGDGSASGRLDVNPSGQQYYPCSGPLSTISEAVLQQQQQQQQYYASQCPTLAYSTSNMAMLNPASYLPMPLPMPGLPLVDADGFPVDYGLPRPNRAVRGVQSHVRFAEPPSVSVRHYENYVVDSEGNQLQPAGDNDFLPDRKYPESYDPMRAHQADGGNQSEVRYPSERYPQDFAPPFPAYESRVAYVEDVGPNPTSGHERQQQQQHHEQQDFLYPVPGQMIKPNSSTSIESSENSTVTLTGGAPSSPFDVSINDASSGTSPGFMCSSTLQRQPHESPDEGYEDEGIDGTEI